MDPRLLGYYNDELTYLRERGREFAAEFPKIAGRLGMEPGGTTDPYVERLLEGFAFLAARVHLRLDAEFPEFTQQLLQMVYPDHLAPLPAMAVVHFSPLLEEAALASGFELPRGTALHATRTRDIQTACEFRTGQALRMWPLTITEARYFGSAGALGTVQVDRLSGVRAGLRISLRTSGGVAFDQLEIDDLMFYLPGALSTASRIYEQLLGNCVGLVVRPKGGAAARSIYLSAESVRPGGFDPTEALLPNERRAFSGYRVLREYFAFPQRFLFFRLQELRDALRQCAGTEVELIALFDRRDAALDAAIDAEQFALNCVPVINLFPKRADRIHLKDSKHEHHVIVDRTRPLDYEVWGVTGVQGFGSGAKPERTFQPLFGEQHLPQEPAGAYYTVHRKPRVVASKQRRNRGRSDYYVGSETFLALVDSQQSPISSDLRQLEAMTLCTNRDLPLMVTPGAGATDFTLDSGAPVSAIRLLAGPTRPRAPASDALNWRLISHLSLNYLSLTDSTDGHGGEGAHALRGLLSLYANSNEQANERQLEGLKSIQSRPVTARLPVPGPVTFGRGLEITIACEEAAFEGTGLFLFGKVLEEFLASYVSINSFTETVIRSSERGEIMKWPPRLGQHRPL